MDEPTPSPSILDLVIAGLGNGLLWILEAGPKPCVVCRAKIGNDDIQYDVAGPRGSLPVHVKCYELRRAR